MNRQTPRSLIVPVLIVIAGITLLINLSAQTTQAVETPFSILLAPLQQAFSGFGRAVSEFFRSASDLQDLRLHANQLQIQVDTLSAENVRLREFQSEVKQYRDLMKFATDNPAFTVVGADVIGIGDSRCIQTTADELPGVLCANVIAGEPSPYSRYLTINVGRKDGIEPGMPVVAGGFALIGRVGQVNEASSQVQLLNDPNSFVNVILVSSRATGVVAGQADGSLRLINVPQTDEVQTGDIIVSSGLGGSLPRLLTIGQVDAIVSTDAQLFKEALIRPIIEFHRAEIVLVITSTQRESP